jgi:OHCU decarboxylase
VTGGAVKAACEAIRERLGGDSRTMTAAELSELLGDDFIEETVEWHHRETYPLDANGQGDAHVQYAFSAHRAVVDVDIELGLVHVVELATAQEVGKAINPQALEGQIQGGTAQGLGLALFEEIQMKDGKVMNASFTDYLLPTILDMPPMRIEILEHADPEAPYGLKGVGEPPNISTPPAVAAALRAATDRPLRRIPVRPEHLVGLGAGEVSVSLADLGALFEHSPWVAEAAWRRRPFASVAELQDALEAAMRDAPRERQLALIRAHPDLAGREAEEGTLTAESSREQASAGLDRLTATEVAALRSLNRSYRERFGFPLIVCVREHTKDSIMVWGTARLEHSREQEIDIALGEISKIVRLRLADVLEEAP